MSTCVSYVCRPQLFCKRRRGRPLKLLGRPHSVTSYDQAQARAAYPDRAFRLLEPAILLHIDYHRKNFASTAWTDDTDQALCILLEYVHNGQPHWQDFAERLHIWVYQGLRALQAPTRGLGATVAAAVRCKDFRADPVRVAFEVWKAGGYHGATNGSLMRCHPLGAVCL